MLRPRIRNKSLLLLPHQAGILLMMRVAPPLALLATWSWEDKLKQIPPGLTSVMPSAKMFEMVNRYTVFVVFDFFVLLIYACGVISNFAFPCLPVCLQLAFAARHKDIEDQLRLRLGEAGSQRIHRPGRE
ncbi:hypothetical protein CK203_042007 [Vitis vinifera]|uniref:Uncharacterized protein n=1 Tax=Vitis vinifera TaxID=29760 RepID=A0A438I0H9_VITVI|nr:hypothetical protein CK203_042007 [Vitis vinifera]